MVDDRAQGGPQRLTTRAARNRKYLRPFLCNREGELREGHQKKGHAICRGTFERLDLVIDRNRDRKSIGLRKGPRGEFVVAGLLVAISKKNSRWGNSGDETPARYIVSTKIGLVEEPKTVWTVAIGGAQSRLIE
jgi:hypothetical protein